MVGGAGTVVVGVGRFPTVSHFRSHFREARVGGQGQGRSRSARLTLPLYLVGVASIILAFASPLTSAIVRPFQVAAFSERNAQCLDCHEELIPQVAEQVVHEPVLAGRCASCHSPHRLSQEARTALRRGDLAARTVRGRSAGIARALVDVFVPRVADAAVAGPGGDAAATADRTAEAVSDDCAGCHSDVGGGTQAGDHPLGDDVTCLTCHAPHASGHKARLVAASDVLCGGCHTVPEGHTDHAGMDCLECHRMHRSVEPPLLRDHATDVCVRCHPEAEGRYDHPTRPTYHDPNSGGGLTCTSSCHDPHGGSYSMMMRCPYGEMGYGTDALCLKCHKPTELP